MDCVCSLDAPVMNSLRTRNFYTFYSSHKDTVSTVVRLCASRSFI